MLLILMLLGIYQHWMVSDPFERSGPALVFTFMLGGRLVVWYQVCVVVSRQIFPTYQKLYNFPDKPQGGRAISRFTGANEWRKTRLIFFCCC